MLQPHLFARELTAFLCSRSLDKYRRAMRVLSLARLAAGLGETPRLADFALPVSDLTKAFAEAVPASMTHTAMVQTPKPSDLRTSDEFTLTYMGSSLEFSSIAARR